jgi:hypothetical protein
MIDCAAITITRVGFEVTVYATDGGSFKGSYLPDGQGDFQSIAGSYDELTAFCKDEALVLALCNIVYPASELAKAIRNQKEK